MARPKPAEPKIQTVIYVPSSKLQEVDQAAGELTKDNRNELINQWIEKGLQEWRASKGIQEGAAAE